MFQKQPPQMFYKKPDLKNFPKFTEKHRVGVFFFIKLQTWDLQLKISSQLFSSEFWEHFKNCVCIKHHWIAASECMSSSKYYSLSA